MASALTTRLSTLRDALLPARDILEERITSSSPPGWCDTRIWTDFLLGLDDAALKRAEAHGLAAVLPELPDAPDDLRVLAREIESASALPQLEGARTLPAPSLRSIKLRKRAQLESVLASIAAMAESAERIVDVGAGSGHLTRLSAELFARPALGLERNLERVAAAARRTGPDGAARFVAVDARQALELSGRDLALGLHACGELGDRLVEEVARAECDLTLVSCCLQKISSAERRALSRAGQGLALRREHLGLTNLTAQPQGIEASIESTIAARQTRFALGRLLRARGVSVDPGGEMSGVNRRRANQGLRVVAERALALRKLPATSDAELQEHETEGAKEYAAVRRLSLPRNMLARALEVLVSLDRASFLGERGLKVQVATLFDRAVSPRNIGIFASRDAARLPTC